jgi:hypothetical protein
MPPKCCNFSNSARFNSARSSRRSLGLSSNPVPRNSPAKVVPYGGELRLRPTLEGRRRFYFDLKTTVANLRGIPFDSWLAHNAKRSSYDELSEDRAVSVRQNIRVSPLPEVSRVTVRTAEKNISLVAIFLPVRIFQSCGRIDYASIFAGQQKLDDFINPRGPGDVPGGGSER